MLTKSFSFRNTLVIAPGTRRRIGCWPRRKGSTPTLTGTKTASSTTWKSELGSYPAMTKSLRLASYKNRK